MTVVQKWNLDITNAQETGKCVCYITSFPYMEILSLNTNTEIKKTVCYTEEFIVGVHLYPVDSMYGLIIEQLSQGMKMVVKHMNKNKEKNTKTNKPTNSSTLP